MKEVTDELIATYLSGNATKEEENLVLDYMGESEEHLDSLLAVADALRVQQESTHHKRKPLQEANTFLPLQKPPIHRYIYSAAASVAILLVVGGIWLWESNNASDTGEHIAMADPHFFSSQEKMIQKEESREDISAYRNMREIHTTQNFQSLAESKQNTKHDFEVENNKEDLLPMESLGPQQDIVAVGSSNKGSAIMAASISTPQKFNGEEETQYVKFLCDIPSQWADGDSLRISWKTSVAGVIIELTSADDYKFSDTIEDGRTSVSYPSSMRGRFRQDGRYFECTVIPLVSKENIPVRKAYIEIIEKNNPILQGLRMENPY